MAFTSTKPAILAGAVVLFALPGVTPAAAQGFQRITTEAGFNQLVVGRKLSLNSNYITIKKNGIVKGRFNGEPLRGYWEWRDGFWCRTLLTHNKKTDCQIWEVDGNRHRLTRERGEGGFNVYTAR